MIVPIFESAQTRMPRLGFGTWPMRGAECQHAVESALAMGYRHVDTAEMYGNGRSEENLGRALRELNAWRRVVVGTKVRLTPADRLDPAG